VKPAIILLNLFFLGLLQGAGNIQPSQSSNSESMKTTQIATLGGGCFWCVEAVYERIDGVEKVVSGYAGGHVDNPTYRQVTSGTTGHAEVVQVHFDPEVVSFESILEMFWLAHDPTTLNRQGADVGPQYRSIILYQGEDQRQLAEASKATAQDQFKDPIVTEIAPLTTFYAAEGYHQNYYELNSKAGYCNFVIRPKLKKLGMETAPLKKLSPAK
jgi:peptide-methionine (S)-S-oxide reductase